MMSHLEINKDDVIIRVKDMHYIRRKIIGDICNIYTMLTIREMIASMIITTAIFIQRVLEKNPVIFLITNY